jgi:hypothetical protein
LSFYNVYYIFGGMATLLKWEMEMGEFTSYPVARALGFKYELPLNRLGKPYALIYFPSGHEILKEFCRPAQAREFCQFHHEAVQNALGPFVCALDFLYTDAKEDLDALNESRRAQGKKECGLDSIDQAKAILEEFRR